jgi:hypothetical protein
VRCLYSLHVRIPRLVPVAPLVKVGAAWVCLVRCMRAVCCTFAPVCRMASCTRQVRACSLRSIGATEPAGGHAPASHPIAGSRRCASACTCACACVCVGVSLHAKACSGASQRGAGARVAARSATRAHNTFNTTRTE